MKAFIVDDEVHARRQLVEMLKAFPGIEVIGESDNTQDAHEKIEKLKPQLLFLDIRLPGSSGFDLLEDLDHVPNVIFTTAYDEYAVKAFEFNALDYLLKPIDPRRLARTLQKVVNADHRSSAVLTDDDQIFVKDRDQCWFVKLKDIRLLESEGNYTRLYFGVSKPLILRSLNYLESRLDAKIFFRANRKYIVNLRSIENIDVNSEGSLIASIEGGHHIELSRRQSQLFKERMSI